MGHGRGALVSGHWGPHKHFLSEKPRGFRAKEEAGREKPQRAPEPLRVPKAAYVPSFPFIAQVPGQALPPPGRGSPILSRGSGLLGAAGSTARQGYTYQRCKRGFRKPAPPTRSRHLIAPPPPTGGEVTSGEERQRKLPRQPLPRNS